MTAQIPQHEHEHTQASGLHATRNTIPLVARILLSVVFLWSGISKILHPADTQAYMTANGMPLVGLFLVVAIVLELGGGLSLLLGIKPRIGAIALLIFTFVATLIFHMNWAEPVQQIMCLKNLAIMGGLLMVVQYGVGNVVVRR